MGRPSHDFRSGFKAAWRLRNVAYYRSEAKELFGTDGRLVCPYLELVGRSGGLSFDLLVNHERILDPSDFVGVDLDRDVVVRHRTESPFEVAYGDGIILAQRLREVGRTIGVMNHDGYGAVGNVRWWNENGSVLQDLAVSAVRSYGAFVLVTNNCLSRGVRSADEAVQSQIRNMSQSFRKVSIHSLQTEKYRGDGSSMFTVRVVLRAV